MTQEWTGCYHDQWKGFLTDASFAHPAKFSRGLIERILEYMREQGWIEPGDDRGRAGAALRRDGQSFERRREAHLTKR